MVAFYNGDGLGDVNQVIALAFAGETGEAGVDLHDQKLALLQNGAVQVGGGNAAAHEPVFVRRGAGDDRHTGTAGADPRAVLA